MWWKYYVPGVPGLLILGVWFLLGVLLGSAVNAALTEVLPAESSTQLGLLLSYPLMFIPAMAYAAWKSRMNEVVWKLRSVDVYGEFPEASLCLLTVLATLALSFCCDASTRILPPMPPALEQLFKEMVGGNVLLNFICVGIFAPFFEEWLCRGMVLRGLLHNGYRPLTAVLVSAAVFALIHANPWQAIPAFVIGTFLGYVYYRTGSLKLTMLLHCANNSLALVCGQIDSLKDCGSWMDLLSPAAYWAVFAACIAVVVIAVKKTSETTSEQ